MPKQILKLDQFHGGINSDADPRDIGQNQMVQLKNLQVNKYGKIKVMGKGILHTSLNTETSYGDVGANVTFPNHGGHNLFSFSHDRPGASDPGNPYEARGDDYIALATGSTGHVSMYSRRKDDWAIAVNAEFDDYSPATDDPYGQRWAPVFTVVDGNLRIGDGNHETENRPIWYGYMDRAIFSNTHPAGKVWDQWRSTSTSLDTPGETAYGKLKIKASGHSGDDALGSFDAADVDWLSYAYPIGLEVRYNKTNDGGWADDVLYYYSIVYGDQESKMVRFDIIDGTNTDESHYKNFRLTVLPAYFVDRNSRATGVKVYWKKATSTTDTTGEPYLLMVADFNPDSGVRKGEDASNWQSWSFMTAADTADQSGYSHVRQQVRSGSSGFTFMQPPRLTTFHNQTGFKDGTGEGTYVTAKYRTAVVANRRMYIGHTQSLPQSGYGNIGEVKGDRILKSLPNDFDTFPEDRHLDVAVQDGDEIVKLETYADRILQFKTKKLQIINVSEDVEFLEATYDFKGISRPAGSCPTDFGIVWANLTGAYFYDGQRVHNLIEKEGNKLISDAKWRDFALTTINASGNDHNNCNIAVGYLPKERAVLFLNNTEKGNGNRDIYYYDMVHQCWTFGETRFPGISGNMRYSNFVNDWNGDLTICGDTGGTSSAAMYFYKWDNTPADSEIQLITKDIDFGEPGVRKKVYRVHITYKGTGSLPNVFYAVNGTESYASATSVTAFSASSSWNRAEYKFSADANSCYSFQLKLEGSAGSSFEINDISFVFRMKNVR